MKTVLNRRRLRGWDTVEEERGHGGSRTRGDGEEKGERRSYIPRVAFGLSCCALWAASRPQVSERQTQQSQPSPTLFAEPYVWLTGRYRAGRPCQSRSQSGAVSRPIHESALFGPWSAIRDIEYQGDMYKHLAWSTLRHAFNTMLEGAPS